jgi:putative nucleotidyltransferase with HDIG domain
MTAVTSDWTNAEQIEDWETESHSRGRKARVLAILSEGLPALPRQLLQLNSLLSSSPVNVREVSSVIRGLPSLAAQLLRLCDSAPFGLRWRVERVEQAAILLGPERLQNLLFASHLMEVTRGLFTPAQAEPFWRHSLLTALASERLVRRLQVGDEDQAYLGGLLHDVGRIPLLMVAGEENSSVALWLKGEDRDWIAMEREYFGLDHCEVGRWLALQWNLRPVLVEVIESHHETHSDRARSPLAGIVSAAGHFCAAMESGAGPNDPAADDFYAHCLPQFASPQRASAIESLRREYPLMRKLVRKAVEGAAEIPQREQRKPA